MSKTIREIYAKYAEMQRFIIEHITDDELKAEILRRYELTLPPKPIAADSAHPLCPLGGLHAYYNSLKCLKCGELVEM